MGSPISVPFNVSLLELDQRKLQGLKPVKALDFFDGANQFHEDGLFSVSTFGKVGTEMRDKRFSYIDIRVPIFHPIIYKTLVDMKGLYSGIMSGAEYAIWNTETNDFERSNSIDGKTGFAFFVSKWKDIKFEETKSITRQQSIALLEKYKSTAMTDKIVVMPAGYRDLEVKNGRITEGDINKFYRQILSIANTVSESAVNSSPEVLNVARYNLQMRFNELYAFIESMVEGKKKLFLGKWASRRIFNGTRNVITAMDTSTPFLDAPDAITMNTTLVGLYQAMKGILPVSCYQIRNGFIASVFTSPEAPAKLVNKKTLKAELVRLKPYYYDRWMTNEGIEKTITQFGDEEMRHRYVEVDGYYIGLIYLGPDNTFKLIHDIGEVPESRDIRHVRPITLCELLYLSVYKVINNYPLFVTRYPVAGSGSIYPSKTYVKTTVVSEKRRPLDDQWAPCPDDDIAYQFPVRDSDFLNTLVPHPSKLKGLEADFDGDTASGNFVYSDESVAEVNAFFKQKRAYVDVDGSLVSSCGIDTVKLVLHNLTGD